MVYRAISVRRSLEATVVEHHELVVLSQADIQLNPIGAKFQGLLKCRDGILRSVDHVATVGDNQW